MSTDPPHTIRDPSFTTAKGFPQTALAGVNDRATNRVRPPTSAPTSPRPRPPLVSSSTPSPPPSHSSPLTKQSIDLRIDIAGGGWGERGRGPEARSAHISPDAPVHMYSSLDGASASVYATFQQCATKDADDYHPDRYRWGKG